MKTNKWLAFILGLFLILGEVAWADLEQAERDEAVLLEELSSQALNPNTTQRDFNPQNTINELQNQLKNRQYRSTRASTWFSKAPNDLAPIKGSVWEFSYTIYTYTFTDTLTFGDTIITDSDGAVGLSCTDEYGREGAVLFTDLPQGGFGFAAGIRSTTIYQMYLFTVSNGIATGKYIHQSHSTGEYSSYYDLTGTMISGPCYSQSDLDAQYEAGKQYCRNNPAACGIQTGDTGFTQAELDAKYEAGKNYCKNNPSACGIETGSTTPPFIGTLPTSAQSYLTLTDNSMPFYLSPGSFFQVFGSQDNNTMNVRRQSQMQFKNSIGANTINIEEASTAFTVSRSGATVYLESTAGTRIEIAATETPQTLCFADGSSDLVISGGNIYLGSQVVTQSPLAFTPDDGGDTSEGLF